MYIIVVCKKCAKCCSNGVLLDNNNDLFIIEYYPNLVSYDSGGRPRIDSVDGKCIALDGNLCSIHEHKPVRCCNYTCWR